ncbi:CaiB/BaiF CoA transferase family protein [Acidimangrovimonas pyrenivorans]|uniref:CaiB/BaiF CoA transferase family protein n=1 Tax=Acidimangrovimonas pyrenivorans TaxID=2030798 RepID=A0ABV7AGK7_9RHOB
MRSRRGPLTGITIVELTGIGPAPYAAMLLADLGARVIRIDRPGGYPALGPGLDFEKMEAASVFYRSRPLVRVDLKSEAGRALLLRLVGEADALIEGYRPGTMERLGLGPEECHAVNPALAYVRVTGWGQDGPRALTAGHDLNYIGLSGALSLFGRDGVPPRGVPPLIGDMAGGALFAVIGLLSAVLHARASGEGQVVDAAITDGSASLYSLLTALAAMGAHDPRGGVNVLDGGRHYYRTYACADGQHIAVGAIEPAFRKVLLEKLGLMGDPRFLSGAPEDESHCTQLLTALFRSKPRAHWVALFEGTDGCVTPVLSLTEAPQDAHNRARGSFVEIDDIPQPAPAPRFAATPGVVSRSPAEAGRADPVALADWGLTRDEIETLVARGTVEPGQG